MEKKTIQKLKSFICFFIVLNILIAGVILKNQGNSGNVIGTSLATAADTASDKKPDPKNGEEGKDAVAEKQDEAEDTKQVLAGLEDKRIQLQKQEDRIKLEQEKLNVLKQELEDKMAELEKTHALIEESLSKLDKKKSEKEMLREAQEDKKIKQLVKVYANMKPKQAGEIINNMDIVIAEKIFLNMKGEAAGKILSYVDSSKAAQISERLAVSIGRNEPNL